jgi:hypothetical protein
MLREGIYALGYRPADTGSATSGPWGEALVALRNGRILGSDRWGGVIDGELVGEPAEGGCKVAVRLLLPPDGELITGATTGPCGAVMEVACAFDRTCVTALPSIDLGGRRVELKLSFIGPLPC